MTRPKLPSPDNPEPAFPPSNRQLLIALIAVPAIWLALNIGMLAAGWMGWLDS